MDYILLDNLIREPGTALPDGVFMIDLAAVMAYGLKGGLPADVSDALTAIKSPFTPGIVLRELVEGNTPLSLIIESARKLVTLGKRYIGQYHNCAFGCEPAAEEEAFAFMLRSLGHLQPITQFDGNDAFDYFASCNNNTTDSWKYWNRVILPNAKRENVRGLEVGNLLLANSIDDPVFSDSAILITEYLPFFEQVYGAGILAGHPTTLENFPEVSGLDCPSWKKPQLLTEVLHNAWSVMTQDMYLADPRSEGKKFIPNMGRDLIPEAYRK